MQLVLSLFPGIGLLDRAFEEHDFCVVRGPDLLWGGDIKAFNPPANRFDGLIGGPPCQRWSRLANVVRAVYGPDKLAEDLIPEFERCVIAAAPRWFLMEQVEGAPLPNVPGYALWTDLLNNRWFGAEQERRRRITFGVRQAEPINLWRFIQLEALENPYWSPAVLASGSNSSNALKMSGKGKPKKLSNMGTKSRQTVAEAIRLQGLPDDFFKYSPLTVEGQQRMIGNGVPLPLGRALAAAVKEAITHL